MYRDQPYAREVGHVGEAAGVATSARVTEGHYVSKDVLAGVLHWLQKAARDPSDDPSDLLDQLRREALEEADFCFNEGCEVVGHLKDFRVCPQCKSARYCGNACHKQDWNAGGHKETCGTLASKTK
jgi:hypothetical protein